MAGTLSGGESQRVALARAFIREPRLLLLDEPFGALDALTRIRMHALLRDLCDRHRPATLLVTHDVDEAIVLADRVLVLADGRSRPTCASTSPPDAGGRTRASPTCAPGCCPNSASRRTPCNPNHHWSPDVIPSQHLRRVAALLALLAATLVVAACGDDDSAGSATAASSSGGDVALRVAYIGTAGKFNGPEGYAYDKGKLQEWLKPAGVSSVKPVEFANGPLATQALIGGSVDIIISGDTPQLISRAQGVPAHAILQNRVGINAWLIGRKDGPKTVDDLAGKRVARQQASFQDRYLQGLLEEKGLAGSAAARDAQPAGDRRPAQGRARRRRDRRRAVQGARRRGLPRPRQVRRPPGPAGHLDHDGQRHVRSSTPTSPRPSSMRTSRPSTSRRPTRTRTTPTRRRRPA